jgi:hypothetical protein
VETFKKRQKEMRRLERQRDKAAKRKELKARKAAGIADPSDGSTETSGEPVASPAETILPPTNLADNVQVDPEGGLVEIRYLGSEQRRNSRAYQFDVREKGQPSRQLAVTADMDLFRLNRVGIQEGPTLSGNKLSADLERGWEGAHELAEADARAYLNSKSSAGAERAEQRKTSRQRSAMAEAYKLSPRRNPGI